MLNGDGAAAQGQAAAAGDNAVHQANIVVRFMENPYTQYYSNFTQLAVGGSAVYFALADFGATAANSLMPDWLDAVVVGVGIWACMDNVYSIITSSAQMIRDMGAAADQVPNNVAVLPM